MVLHLKVGGGIGNRVFGEMMGMDGQTSRAVTGRAPVNREQPQRLGDALLKLMDGQIAPRRDRLQPVTEVWQQLLPAELLNNCTIAGIAGSRLKVVAKSPAHQFELRLCSCELIKELAVRCPRAKIQTIDISVGPV
jgi:hypothetical protein